jgi:uncharacterized protein YdeI (YjbR/CyaY-like superfamily)
MTIEVPPEQLYALADALRAHGDEADEVLVRMAKKHTGVASLDWASAVEVALCFGWIDGRSQRIDDDWFVQRFTPRRPASTWSKVNRVKAEALIAAGRMRPAGLAEVERARADGRFDAAYAGQRTAEIPEDLQRELDARPAAREFFGTLSSQNRYAILYRLQDAKRPETRARRLAQFIAMLEAGETIHP